MAAIVRYSAETDLVETWGTPRLGSITGLVMVADQATVGQSVIELPDKGGVHAVRGLRRLTVAEDDSPDDFQVIYVGNLGPRDYTRNEEHLIGSDRLIRVSVADLNNLLATYLIKGAKDAAHGDRPAEKDLERIAWLMGSAFISGQIHDLGLISTTGGVDMDAADLRGQNAGNVLRDCGLLSGKQWFLYYDETQPAGARIGLFYDFTSAEVFTSTLRLSNFPDDADDPTDPDAITFAMAPDPPPTQRRDPSQIITNVTVDYDGGSLSVDSDDIGLTTKTDYYVREVVAPSVNTKVEATAQRLAERMLRDHDKEEDSATVTVLLPSTKVGLIKAGHRIECAFEHFEPAYRTFTWWRITKLTLNETDERYWWKVDLEMEPIPPVCPEATPSQTFPALHPVDVFGPASDALGNVHYLAPGVSYPQVPTPFHIGKWHFPVYDAGVDHVDYGYAGASNLLRFVVVGDGILTIPTRIDITSEVKGLRARLQHRTSPTDGTIIVDEEQLADSGSTFVFVISTEEEAHCSNWVDIEADPDDTSHGDTAAVQAGYAGDATWVLA